MIVETEDAAAAAAALSGAAGSHLHSAVDTFLAEQRLRRDGTAAPVPISDAISPEVAGLIEEANAFNAALSRGGGGGAGAEGGAEGGDEDAETGTKAVGARAQLA